VTLSDHNGNGLAGGVASYKSGPTTLYLNGTSGASTTDGSGQVTGQLFDGTYDFRMQYNQGTEWKYGVSVSNGSTVAFQTGLLSIVYSNPISYGGSVGDSTFFTKAGTELLPGTYNFHPRNVGYPSNSGCKPISIDSPAAGTTATKSIIAAELKNSTGAPLSGGTVGYWYMGWHGDHNTYGDFGPTDSHGAACIVFDGDLSGYNYTSVAMFYNHTRQQKGPQNVASNSVFSFQTGEVVSDGGTATTYYHGGYWPFTNGMELLPGSYYFQFSDQPQVLYSITAGVVNHIH
jgi:hypothetical protein